ncbi:hypothetical protein [Nocardia sp. CY41]|uniref:hypothetical protein n=1 Tax=Nocardia sp. CY41 TaxID=2608686 RepID=UPI0013598E5A|nr:hypothetical protein [Nocardia sp. CY41]
MSGATNLAYPETPFGNPGQSTGRDSPTVAAVAVTTSGTAGLAYATFDVNRPHDMESAPEGFSFGYEVLSEVDSQVEFTIALDRRMAECDRYAEVITGHNVHDILKPLCSSANGRAALPCLTKYAELWPNRHERRTRHTPLLVDTAIDLEISAAELPRTCAAAKLSSSYLHSTCNTWRRPVTTAFASALLTAQSRGWCRWQALDLDPLVTASAHEQP